MLHNSWQNHWMLLLYLDLQMCLLEVLGKYKLHKLNHQEVQGHNNHLRTNSHLHLGPLGWM
jgi:hypothetical protein